MQYHQIRLERIKENSIAQCVALGSGAVEGVVWAQCKDGIGGDVDDKCSAGGGNTSIAGVQCSANGHVAINGTQCAGGTGLAGVTSVANPCNPNGSGVN